MIKTTCDIKLVDTKNVSTNFFDNIVLLLLFAVQLTIEKYQISSYCRTVKLYI